MFKFIIVKQCRELFDCTCMLCSNAEFGSKFLITPRYGHCKIPTSQSEHFIRILAKAKYSELVLGKRKYWTAEVKTFLRDWANCSCPQCSVIAHYTSLHHPASTLFYTSSKYFGCDATFQPQWLLWDSGCRIDSVCESLRMWLLVCEA